MTLRIVRALATVVTIVWLVAGLSPKPVLADDSSRISQLELEIQRLRTRVDEQQRRILRLEEELDRRKGPGIPALPKPDHDPGDAADSAAAIKPMPWHTPKSWASVAKGMTEAEVKEILGTPTSAEAVGAFKTMFYRGPVAGAGSLSGIVNLREGRVVAVNAPDF